MPCINVMKKAINYKIISFIELGNGLTKYKLREKFRNSIRQGNVKISDCQEYQYDFDDKNDARQQE